jgi:hypothetical protein
MESSFGKMSLQKKVMRLKYRKDISLQEAWNEVLGKKTTKKKTKKSMKLSKSDLNKLTLVDLKKLAKKHKVSCYKKGTKKCVKKSTLINRLLKIKKSNKSNKFGPGLPPLNSWSDITAGNTQAARNKHYKNTPTSFIFYNQPSNIKYSKGSLMPSQPPYDLVSHFGQYFH